MPLDGIARLREQFLHSGTAPQQIRPDVASSWLRSSTCSVRPETIEPPYRADLDPETALVRAARPVLRTVQDRLGELGVSFLVCDRDGRILDRRVRNSHLLGRLDRTNVTPGYVFAEDAVGTNGIGTAIELGRTTRIDGHEHYLDALVGFTCVGVPITDPIRRRPIGVLDVTCAAEAASPLLDLIAEQTARAIEARLLAGHPASERALLDHFLAADRRTRGGLVVLGERILMANPQAARLFDDLDHPLLRDHAARALSAPGTVEAELELPDGRVVATRTRALLDGGEVIGSMMELRSPAPARAARPALPAAPAPPPGLTGTDRAFHQAYAAAAAALGDRVVLVCGEAGVGKTALGRALLGHAVEREAALATVDGADAWLAALGAVLATRPAALLVQHVDLLGARALRRLGPLLSAAVGRGVRCVVTATGGIAAESALLPDLDAERVRLPPLRDRLTDLPALVAARVRGRRVEPEVLQLFLRMPWPGNVRELHAVLGRMLDAGGQGGPLGLAEVPADVRRAAPRRPLTRFEQAEIHAVLDALAETGGNKRDAAAVLGISRSTLYRKLRNAGIDLESTVF